jgi:hypothetical protein
MVNSRQSMFDELTEGCIARIHLSTVEGLDWRLFDNLRGCGPRLTLRGANLPREEDREKRESCGRQQSQPCRAMSRRMPAVPPRCREGGDFWAATSLRTSGCRPLGGYQSKRARVQPRSPHSVIQLTRTVLGSTPN